MSSSDMNLIPIYIFYAIEHFHVLKHLYLNRFSLAYNKKTKENILVVYITRKLEAEDTCTIQFLDFLLDSFIARFSNNMREKISMSVDVR